MVPAIGLALSHLIDRWTTHLRRHKAQRTAIDYSASVRLAIAWLGRELGRPAELSDLTYPHLQAWLDVCSGGPATLYKHRGGLRSFFRWALLQGALAFPDPTRALVVPALEHKIPRFLPPADARAILRAPLLGRVHDALLLRDAAVLICLYVGGLRREEVVRLNLGDVLLDQPCPGWARLLVHGKGKRERAVPLSPPSAKLFGAYLRRRAELGPRDEALFVIGPIGGRRRGMAGCRLGLHGVYYVVRRWAKAVGQMRIHPHLLRHGAATHLVDGGAEIRTVQVFLGHASIATTQLYVNVSGKQLMDRCAGHHPAADAGFFGPDEGHEDPPR